MSVFDPKRTFKPSSAGKDRLGNISKRGDRYLRSLFMTGALALCQNPWHQASTLAHNVAGATDEHGGHPARQQDRQNVVGDYG
jgi:transposase